MITAEEVMKVVQMLNRNKIVGDNNIKAVMVQKKKRIENVERIAE